jgi:hypothetical protein
MRRTHVSSGTGAADSLEATVRNGHICEFKQIFVVEEFCVLGKNSFKTSDLLAACFMMVS